MTSNEILKADVLDIVFDNRNKNYGAYVLRKYYNNRLLIAMSWMMGVVLTLILIVLFNPETRNTIFDINNAKDSVIVRTWQETQPPPPPPVQPPQQRFRRINDVNNIVIADRTTVPTQDNISKSVISNQNVEGIEINGTEQPHIENNGPTTPLPSVESTPPPPAIPSSPAAFPGGLEKWMQFLSKNLNTPSELEAGQKRSVLVRFTVGEDGSVTRFEIVQSGGEAFDREVLRVLKKMPKWKPAIQNGHPVSVLFTQPVTFVAIEE